MKTEITKRCGSCKEQISCGCIKKNTNQVREYKHLLFSGKFDILLDENGVTVTVHTQFYNQLTLSQLASDMPEVLETLIIDENASDCLDARFVFCQIRNSMRRGEVSEIYYTGKVLELIFYVSRKKKPTSAMLNSNDTDTVNKARAIILENLQNCPKIYELALMVHTCPAKLQKDFKTAFGTTIHDFAQAERLKRAAGLLTDSDEPIYAVAKSVGYNKAGRFSEIFRDMFGVTPSEYREQIHG